METLYKVLNKNRMPYHGGHGQWPYRKWTDKIKTLIPCEQGYHVCRIDQLVNWLGPEIWEVEVRGQTIDNGNKLVVESARLVRKTNWSEKYARLFAADCAEHVLPYYESKYPGDNRPRLAIEAARKYANGLTSKKELRVARVAANAAAVAAYYVASDAGYYAVRAAAYAADAYSASYASAAYTAAKAAAVAAYHAAYHAANAANAAAEREWQTERLKHYLK